MILRLFGIFPAIALLIGVAAGCANDDDGGSPTPTGDNSVSETLPGGDGQTPSPGPTVRRGLTLAEYFTAIDTVFETADGESDALAAQLNAESAATTSFAEEVEVIQSFLGATIDVYSTAIGGMDLLEPPDEVATPHDAFIDTALEAATLASDLQIQIGDAQTDEAGRALIEQFQTDIDAIVLKADATCTTLQGIATQNAIEVDLNCED